MDEAVEPCILLDVLFGGHDETHAQVIGPKELRERTDGPAVGSVLGRNGIATGKFSERFVHDYVADPVGPAVELGGGPQMALGIPWLG